MELKREMSRKIGSIYLLRIPQVALPLQASFDMKLSRNSCFLTRIVNHYGDQRRTKGVDACDCNAGHLQSAGSNRLTNSQTE